MRAATFSMPNISRATRAAMMLELSPLDTAAKAPASSMPASRRVSWSKPTPVTHAATETGAQSSEGGGVLVDHGDRVPLLLQGLREGGTHPAAAHDDDVHDRPSEVKKSRSQ